MKRIKGECRGEGEEEDNIRRRVVEQEEEEESGKINPQCKEGRRLRNRSKDNMKLKKKRRM